MQEVKWQIGDGVGCWFEGIDLICYADHVDFLLGEAARQRYAQMELDALAFEGPPPDAADLGQRWKGAVAEARELIAALPPEEAGCCVLGTDGTPYGGKSDDLRRDLPGGRISFHPGRIGGVWPTIKNKA